MKRLALALIVLAGCGSEEPERPPGDTFFVIAEDHAQLAGEALVSTSKLNPQILTVELTGGGPVLAGHPPITWTFSARISRAQALANEVPEITWPNGDLAGYESHHGAGASGTATLSFAGGRVHGTVRSAGGKKAIFEGAVHVKCMVKPGDFEPPLKLPPATDVVDEKLETSYCTPLKALRF